jgi:hypothetical protein
MPVDAAFYGNHAAPSNMCCRRTSVRILSARPSKKRLIDQAEYGSGAIRFGPPMAYLVSPTKSLCSSLTRSSALRIRGPLLAAAAACSSCSMLE